MKFRKLIAQSKKRLEGNPPFEMRTFQSGGNWMQAQLTATHTEGQINFSAYGILKYSIAVAAFILSALLLVRLNAWLTPLAVVVFYFAEVHFLFLFPLLIDDVKYPLTTSIRQTYKVGIWKVLFNVIPIGFYMLAGLLRFRDPLRNWYVGCQAIVLWYCDEVRDRI